MNHGHSHAHGGARNDCCGSSHSHSQEEFDGDFARAACCVRDEEDRKKHMALLRKLRAADPTRIAMQLREDAKPQFKSSPTYWSDNMNKSENVNSNQKTNGYEEQQEEDNSGSDINSDFEDEELLRKMINNRLASHTDDQDQNHALESKFRRYICSSEDELRMILGENPRLICCFHDNSSVSTSVIRNLETAFVQRAVVNCVFASIDMRFITKQPHPLILSAFSKQIHGSGSSAGSSGFSEKALSKPPIVIAFSSGFKATSGLLCSDLEKIPDLTGWLETVRFESGNSIFENQTSEKVKNDGDDAVAGDGFVCKKPGCTRRFNHEHIQHVSHLECP